MGVPIRAYARHRGVSPAAVRKALATGRITKLPDGSIDPARADREWDRNTDQSKPSNTVKGGHRPQRASRPPPEPPLETGGGGDEDGPRLANTYAASRAAREAYMARLAKLEFEQKSGKLVDADEVRAQMFALGRRVRDSVMGVPDRLTPVLAGQEDHATIHRLLTDELIANLSVLSAAPAIVLNGKTKPPA